MIGEESGITIGLAVLIFGALAALWWRVEARIAKVDTDADLRIEREQTARRILEKEFADYRIWAGQNHVSASALRDTEERLITAVDKLASRLETVITRIEKLTIEVASAGRE